MKIGVEGFTFDSAHFTGGMTEKCKNLHGHTFRVDVEVEGEVDERSGMVLDFTVVKNCVKEVLEGWDHKLLVPRAEAGKLRVGGPFNLEIKYVDGPSATAECIAADIAREVHERLKMPVRVTVYEGARSRATCEWPP